MAHARTSGLVQAAPAADPIHAAIARHRAAYEAYQVAPEGEPTFIASDDYDAASAALVASPCSTRFGALALLDHLNWWLREEAEFRATHKPAYGIARARAADLALFLGGPAAAVTIPQAAPSGRLGRPLPACDRYRHNAPSALPPEPLPGEPEAWEAVAPIRPDTAHVRALRFLDRLGEALAAFALVIGGGALVGLASLI